MHQNPLVSIVIPCYNHGDYLLDAINSVLEQSFRNIEIIVVNDGSDDKETLEILNSINNPLIKILSQENAGPVIARNNALKIAKGKYFIPLDADDLICHDTIENAVKAIERDPEIAVVHGDCQYFGEKNHLFVPDKVNAKNILIGRSIPLCTLIRKEAFDQVGGFDEFLSRKGLEDWDLWLTLLEKGWKFEYLSGIQFKIRDINSSRTYQVANKNLPELKSYIYKKHSDLLAKEFELFYHENKNLKNTQDYQIGNMILKPFRWIKKRF